MLGTKSLLRMLAALGPSGLAAESELLGVRVRHLLHGCLAALHQGVILLMSFPTRVRSYATGSQLQHIAAAWCQMWAA